MKSQKAADGAYVYEDDLENFNLVEKNFNYKEHIEHYDMFANNHQDDNSDNNFGQVKINTILIQDQEEGLCLFNCKKTMNIITSLLLCLCLTIPLIYYNYSNRLEVFFSYYKTKTLHFQIISEMFYCIWVMITSK
jgi:hypothetical protein